MIKKLLFTIIALASCMTSDLQAMHGKRKDFDEEKEQQNPDKRRRQDETKERGTKTQTSSDDSKDSKTAQSATVLREQKFTTVTASSNSSSSSGLSAEQAESHATEEKKQSNEKIQEDDSLSRANQLAQFAIKSNSETNAYWESETYPISTSTETKSSLPPLPSLLAKALNDAAKSGDVTKAQEAIAAGAQPDARDEDGLTALHYAAESGQTNIIQLLITLGTNVNVQDMQGCTPLYVAAENGHADVVRVLITEGQADVNAVNYEGFMPLYVAAENGHVDVVRVLITEGHANANTIANQGFTALQIAAENGHADVVHVLITEGHADVNPADTEGLTPLFLAARGGYTDVVRALLAGAQTTKKHVNIDTAGNDDSTPLCVAAEHGHADVVLALITEGHADVNAVNAERLTPLFLAARDGHVDVVRALLAGTQATKQHINIDAADNNGCTPLYAAAQNGHAEVVRVLITEGHANVDAKTKVGGFTPLHVAAENGRSEIVHALIAEGHADVNAVNAEGLTPLYIAAQNGHTDVVRALLAGAQATKQHVNIDAADNDGCTPLCMGAENGHADVVLVLIMEGHADVNAVNTEGLTLLYVAAQHGHATVVNYLLTHGARPNATTNEGFTALHTAAECGHEEVVRTLITEGKANIDAVSKEGVTALQIAVHHGRHAIIRLLAQNDHVDARGINGWTALHYAVDNRDIAAIELLRQYGASPMIQNNDHKTPLQMIMANGSTVSFSSRTKIIKLLLKDFDSIKQSSQENQLLLFEAIENGDTSMIECLIDAGINLGMRDEHGRSALYLAASYGFTRIVQLLLKAGADPNATTPEDYQQPFKVGDEDRHEPAGEWSPLHVASFFGYLGIVQLLIQWKAEINAHDHRNQTPLFCAINGYDSGMRDAYETIELTLLAAGADVNALTNQQARPLYRLIEQSHFERLAFARLLIALGANLEEEQDSDDEEQSDDETMSLSNLIRTKLNEVADELAELRQQLDDPETIENRQNLENRRTNLSALQTLLEQNYAITARQVLKDLTLEITTLETRTRQQYIQNEMRGTYLKMRNQYQHKTNPVILEQIEAFDKKIKNLKQLIILIKQTYGEKTDLSADQLINSIEVEIKTENDTAPSEAKTQTAQQRRPWGPRQMHIMKEGETIEEAESVTVSENSDTQTMKTSQLSPIDVFSIGANIAEFLHDLPSSDKLMAGVLSTIQKLEETKKIQQTNDQQKSQSSSAVRHFNAAQIQIFAEFIQSFLQSHRPSEHDSKDEKPLSTNALTAAIGNELLEIDINDLNASALLDRVMAIMWTGNVISQRLAYAYENQVGMQQIFRTALQKLLEQKIIAGVEMKASAETHDARHFEDDEKDNSPMATTATITASSSLGSVPKTAAIALGTRALLCHGARSAFKMTKKQ